MGFLKSGRDMFDIACDNFAFFKLISLGNELKMLDKIASPAKDNISEDKYFMAGIASMGLANEEAIAPSSV